MSIEKYQMKFQRQITVNLLMHVQTKSTQFTE